LNLIKRNPNITTQEMSDLIGIDRSNVWRNMKMMQQQGIIRRVGPDKGGHWEIIEQSNK
jgi:predicted HTH transcriptional regulator